MTNTVTLGKTVFVLIREMVVLMAREMVLVMVRNTVFVLLREMVVIMARKTVFVLAGETVVVLTRKMVVVMADSDRPSGEKRGEELGQSGGQTRPKGKTFGHLEGGGYVLGLLVHGDAGLGAGAAGPDKEVRPDLREIPGPARNDDRGGAR
jgi:hypothetical protein